MSDKPAISNKSHSTLLAPTGRRDVATGGATQLCASRNPWKSPECTTAPAGAEESSSKPDRSSQRDSTPLLILKLGGSILTGDSDLSLAVNEIYRHLRAGRRIIAVVSALHGATDRLLSRARRFTDTPSDAALASLLSTGELTSAALLTLACERAGIPARTLDSAQVELRAQGPTLDATPTSVNTRTILAALESTPVLILPGFIARDDRNNPVLLGRGGSDLTALFLARELDCPCRLLKDVPGVFDRDPHRDPKDASTSSTNGRAATPASCPEGAKGCSHGWSAAEPVESSATFNRPGRDGGVLSPERDNSDTPRRYQSLSFSNLETLNAKVVQPKTAAFARENQIEFEVGAPLSDDTTRVGPGITAFDPLPTPDSPLPTSPLRIALLGHGTVGAGVARAIRRQSDLFTPTAVAIRDREKHAKQGGGLPRRLFTTDPYYAVRSSADIVIELIGGIEPARTLIATALKSGKHVITANKAVIAQFGDELRAIAQASGVQLAYSAAVGGSLPILETARRLESTRGVVSLEAILNGATNFILTRLQQGAPFPTTLAEAQAKGLTEADPTRDLSGQDALDKLQVIAQELWPDLPTRSSLIPLPSRPLPGTRQVARLHKHNQTIHLQVAPEVPAPTSPLSRCAYENNSAIFTTADGHQTVLSGKGAGRHPTTESVLADLLDLAKLPILTSASY